MRIAIVGAGGVGGYFGGRLAEAGADVTFIARGAHLDAMRAHGLKIRSPKGDLHLPRVNAFADPNDVGPVDIVFFAVKLYDTDAALALLSPLMGPNTVVIPLQNGIDAASNVQRAVGREHTAGGTCYVSAVIEAPGVIRHTAWDRLVFGELDEFEGTHSPRLQQLSDACGRTNFQATLSDNITVEIWTKFVRLSVFSGMTTVTRSPIGVTVNNPALFAMLKSAVAEALAVAHAKGVPVPDTMVEDVAKAYSVMPPEAKASMLEDLERGRRIELPWLSGAVARLGREVGVPTPIHSFITAVLTPHVNGAS